MPAGILEKDTMFSVRETPWHRLGTVLPDYPKSIDEALEKSGLAWNVGQGSVLTTHSDGDPFAPLRIADEIVAAYSRGIDTASLMEQYAVARANAPEVSFAPGFKANLRTDDKEVLGIVSHDYKVVQNREAFAFLDALIGSDLHFETAGSLSNGRKVWVLARLPEWIEIGGDGTGIFVYVANAHDGSMAVTASTTGVRIVCRNTLTWALRQSEHGVNAGRTYKFRHTGDLAIKFDEARKVMGITLNYAKQMKALGDRLAMEPFGDNQLQKVLDGLIPIDTDTMGKIAVNNRVKKQAQIIDLFNGRGKDGDTRGNSPKTKWAAVNAVAEHADWQRRYTKATDQMARSFEDTDLKQRALDLISVA